MCMRLTSKHACSNFGQMRASHTSLYQLQSFPRPLSSQRPGKGSRQPALKNHFSRTQRVESWTHWEGKGSACLPAAYWLNLADWPYRLSNAQTHAARIGYLLRRFWLPSMCDFHQSFKIARY